MSPCDSRPPTTVLNLTSVGRDLHAALLPKSTVSPTDAGLTRLRHSASSAMSPHDSRPSETVLISRQWGETYTQPCSLNQPCRRRMRVSQGCVARPILSSPNDSRPSEFCAHLTSVVLKQTNKSQHIFNYLNTHTHLYTNLAAFNRATDGRGSHKTASLGQLCHRQTIAGHPSLCSSHVSGAETNKQESTRF